MPSPVVYRTVEIDFREEPLGEEPEKPDRELTEEQLNAKLENATVNLGQTEQYTSLKSAVQVDAEIEQLVNELAQGYQSEVDAKTQAELELAARQLEALQQQKKQQKENPDLYREDAPDQSSNEADNGKAFMLGYLIEGTPERYGMRVPAPSYLCKESGMVVIEIKVNQNGQVVAAKTGSSVTIEGKSYSTSTSNECLISRAMKYAKKSKFNENYSAPRSQSGYIVYRYGAQ